MPSSCLSTLRLACLLCLTSNLILLASAAMKGYTDCQWYTPADPNNLPHSRQQDTNFPVIDVPESEKSTVEQIFQLNDQQNKEAATLQWHPNDPEVQDIHLDIILPHTGRQRLVELHTTDNQVASILMKDSDECYGTIRGSGLRKGKHVKLASVQVKTLYGTA